METNKRQAIIEEFTRPEDLEGRFSIEEVKDLFVGMCVYSRLGFLQPPCCLRCSYDNSEDDESKKRESNLKCQKPVVWRINASSSHLLHPEKLKGNLMVIPCSSARSLLRGKSIQGKKWDRENLMLVDNEEMKI